MTEQAAGHPAGRSDEQLLRECEVTRTRRSGPGGQHRNKVETAIVLRHRSTGVRAEAAERRSQAANQQQALFRLRLRLALEIRSPWVAEAASRETPAPSELWRSRARGGKIRVNPEHADYPVLLAEALDHLDASNLEPRAAAEALEVTASQLTKFLKAHPAAFEQVNHQRQKLGYHPLR